MSDLLRAACAPKNEIVTNCPVQIKISWKTLGKQAENTSLFFSPETSGNEYVSRRVTEAGLPHVVLPFNHTGSERWYLQRYPDTMATVRARRPRIDLFRAVTCNPNWLKSKTTSSPVRSTQLFSSGLQFPLQGNLTAHHTISRLRSCRRLFVRCQGRTRLDR